MGCKNWDCFYNYDYKIKLIKYFKQNFLFDKNEYRFLFRICDCFWSDSSEKYEIYNPKKNTKKYLTINYIRYIVK